MRADDWLRVLEMRTLCSKSWEAWKGGAGKAKRWREKGSVGCRRRILYLSTVLLEREGDALASDR